MKRGEEVSDWDPEKYLKARTVSDVPLNVKKDSTTEGRHWPTKLKSLLGEE